jgi:hypothetical protein
MLVVETVHKLSDNNGGLLVKVRKLSACKMKKLTRKNEKTPCMLTPGQIAFVVKDRQKTEISLGRTLTGG